MKKRAMGSILATMGGTPLVEMKKLMPGSGARILAKVEWFNPGGSIKDRAAASMLLAKIHAGELEPARSVVIESSSGNLGISIAQICRYYGIRFICVVDRKTTRLNLAILHAYGASVEVVTHPDPLTGDYLSVRLRRVRELMGTTPHAFWPNQYENPLNPRAHEQTMGEISDACDGRVDYLFCATSTTGTLVGCAEYVRQNRLQTTIVAVDAVGSVLFGPQPDVTRLLPGHGTSVRPKLFDPSAAGKVVHVSDLECVVGCRRLILREAILAGGSSGAVIAAFEKLSGVIPRGATCVLILADSGERYLDTIYSDDWVTSHFGEVSQLWKDSEVTVVNEC
jgi:cysteine synthase A